MIPRFMSNDGSATWNLTLNVTGADVAQQDPWWRWIRCLLHLLEVRVDQERAEYKVAKESNVIDNPLVRDQFGPTCPGVESRIESDHRHWMSELPDTQILDGF